MGTTGYLCRNLACTGSVGWRGFAQCEAQDYVGLRDKTLKKPMKWKPTDAPNVSFMYYTKIFVFILF